MSTILTDSSILHRSFWVSKIQQYAQYSGNFIENYNLVARDLKNDINSLGVERLVNHLRLCGDIPEWYKHDSTEEKLYSKYTDALLSESYNFLGLNSIVLSERGDAADVEAYTQDYSFVADAKAFRLSRTAKNQKDFKVQAMDTWKRGKPFAMVVCPIYQLPSRSSQIYEQATTRNVCIFTYSHLSTLILFSYYTSSGAAINLLENIFNIVNSLNPSKDANPYWYAINKTMLGYSPIMNELWKTEKIVSSEAINLAKNSALNFLAAERERIMKMSHEEAISELIKMNKVENRIQTIQSVASNNILSM